MPPVASDARDLPAQIFDRADALRAERGIGSARELSLQVTGKPDFMRNLRDGAMPKSHNLDRLAEVLGTTVDYLLGRAETPDQVRSEVGVSDRVINFRGFPEPSGDPIPLVGSGDCADLQVSDVNGHLVAIERSTFDPDYTVRFIRRPPALLGARDIYAIEFRGDSMLDRFEDGDIGLVDPGRSVRNNDYVLVQLRERPGSNHVGSVLAKRLLRRTDTHYVLQQLNPRLTFLLPKDDVVRLHRILSPNDLLF